jgi:hypothetical protein
LRRPKQQVNIVVVVVVVVSSLFKSCFFSKKKKTAKRGVAPTRTSRNYIRGALQYLVPVLTEGLTKQPDEPEEDQWNIPMASGTCLDLIAQLATGR